MVQFFMPHSVELVSATHICVDVDVNYLYSRSRNFQLLHFSVPHFQRPLPPNIALLVTS